MADSQPQPRTRTGRLIGHVSLGAMATGFLALEVLTRTHVLVASSWQVWRTAFEAGTIGGLADWYAVTVLFRPAPRPLRWIPLFARHSNLIARNRPRLTASVVDLVQNHWLAPAAIRARLQELALSDLLLHQLEELSRQPTFRSELAAVLHDALHQLSETSLADFLDRVLKDQLATLDLASPLGRWMQAALARGDHARLWRVIGEILQRGARDPAVHARIVQLLRQAADAYRHEGMMKRMGVGFLEWLGAFNYEVGADQLLAQAGKLLAEACADPQQPLRQRIDAFLTQFAADLAAGQPAAVATVNDLRAGLLRHADLRAELITQIRAFKATAAADLRDPSSSLLNILVTALQDQLRHLRAHAQTRARLDAWLRLHIEKLLLDHHSEIGKIVRQSLSPEKMSDAALVAQVEQNIGDDLQFVRLNGALVGFLVGLLFALASLLLSQLL